MANLTKKTGVAKVTKEVKVDVVDSGVNELNTELGDETTLTPEATEPEAEPTKAPVEEDAEDNEDVTETEPEVEVDVEETQPEIEVEVRDLSSITQATEKNVRIRLRRDHRCHVGGENYTFKKDKSYVVPIEVKRVLARADLLLPL